MSRSSSESEPLPVAFLDERDALLAMLKLSDGTFSLSQAVCNSPVLRDRLIDEIRQQRSDVERLDLPAGLVDVYGFVKEHAQSDQSGGLLITGLEASVSSRDTDNESLRSLNASRDLWEKQFPRPVVFWLPEYATRELTTEAVDFNRYFSHRFSFSGDAPVWPPVDRREPTATFLMASQLNVEEKQSRIDELHSRLAGTDRTDPRLLPRLTNWTRELSYLLEVSGELESAERVCRDLMPVALAHPETPASAYLWGNIADVLERRGELDEALRIRREEELPVYERLGDVRGSAVVAGQIANILATRGALDEALELYRRKALGQIRGLGMVRDEAIFHGRIADILYDQGELEEALRIRREEELPVYDKLGDIRGKTVTQGKIADVLQAQGELDEVLRIRREEQLPVYAQFGDFRQVAITQGQIADVLQARGELEEALRIRREKELPGFERVGDVRELLVSRAKYAMILIQRNLAGDRDEAAELLRQAHAAAEKMGIPEAAEIREIQNENGFPD